MAQPGGGSQYAPLTGGDDREPGLGAGFSPMRSSGRSERTGGADIPMTDNAGGGGSGAVDFDADSDGDDVEVDLEWGDDEYVW